MKHWKKSSIFFFSNKRTIILKKSEWNHWYNGDNLVSKNGIYWNSETISDDQVLTLLLNVCCLWNCCSTWEVIQVTSATFGHIGRFSTIANQNLMDPAAFYNKTKQKKKRLKIVFNNFYAGTEIMTTYHRSNDICFDFLIFNLRAHQATKNKTKEEKFDSHLLWEPPD